MPGLLKTRLSDMQRGTTAPFGTPLDKMSELHYERPAMPDASTVAQAISLHESSGGKNLVGASGEQGSFQFMPETWKIVSRQVLGKDNVPQTPDVERLVATQKISQLLQRFGGDVRKVAMVWNTSLGGSEQPISTKGINKKGVKFDSNAYADAVMSLYEKLSSSVKPAIANAQVAGAAAAMPTSPLLKNRLQLMQDPVNQARQHQSVFQAIGQGAKSLWDIIVPNPSTPEEAQKMGLIPIKGPFSGEDTYLDPTMAMGSMENVAKGVTTKLLNRLEAWAAETKNKDFNPQMVLEWTNSPDVKQVERDLFRNVLTKFAPQQSPETLAQAWLNYKQGAKANTGKALLSYLDSHPDEAAALAEKTQKLYPLGTTLYRVGDSTGLSWTTDLETVKRYFPDEPVYRVKVTPEIQARIMASEDTLPYNTFVKYLPEAEVLIRPKNYVRQDRVPIADFADSIRNELLPLSPSHLKDGRYENISLPDELRGPVADYTERIYSSPIKTSAGDVHYSGEYPNANYFAHTRIEDLPGGKTRRVIEAQSDLFQKGRLEGEGYAIEAKQMADGSVPHDDMLKNMYDKRSAELSKLEPYRNTWHERIIREEVKQAAIDGKTKLQFPTGETAMKIEGLGTRADEWSGVTPDKSFEGGYRSEVLPTGGPKVGQLVYRDVGQNITDTELWVVTDVLGTGKFKAVQKDIWENKGIKYTTGEIEDYKETFDISGKTDTENPIYRFYEKEVGRYLINKYDAKRITDSRGVAWWELNVPKQASKLPVEAYAALPLIGLGGRDQQ